MMAVFRERHAFRPGDSVHLTPVAGMSHLFDEASGERLA
jgi:multiple sugar transport system ATP-binding protein